MEGLIDTRNEYIEHIQDILSVAISKRIYAIYTEMIDEKKGLKGFQNELYSIRKWNNNMVADEYKKIVKYTKCKYLSNLIKIIIITTIKIKIYEYREQFDNIKIKIPNPEDFVHKCYINAAAFSWKNAYLYNRNNIKDAEYQNNLNIIEENIRAIIKKTFRDFVPFDEIFKQIEDNLTENVKQFKDDEGNDEDDDDDEEDAEVETFKSVKPVKKIKKDEKIIAIEEEEDDEEVSEGDEDEGEDEEDGEGDEENDEGEEGENDEDEEGEEGDEDEEGEEGEEGDEDDEEGEDDEDDEGEEEDDGEDDEDVKEKEGIETIKVVKEQEDTIDNKINIIVDTSLTKYNNGEFKEGYKETSKIEEDTQEISFTKYDKPDIQEKQDANEKEKDAVCDVWSNIKAEYTSLSQNDVDYKKYENEIVSKKYENEDDTKSVSSVLSNFTDISQVKQIHINETANKNRKPSFF
jgi:hypothetical protein